MTHSEYIEGVQRNNSLFLRYNKGRIKILISQLQESKTDLFKLIPFLLHVNKPDLPGYIDHPLVLYGIYGLPDTDFWDFSLKKLKLDEKHISPWISRKYHIIALYLMGSSGTVAQGYASDFDYWLIIDKEKCSERQISLLNKKIEAIKKWSYDQFRQDVEFFIMDISDLRKNHFSSVTDESSGTAQKTILKEEFYRTFIFIAGKLPCWAVFNPGLNDLEYVKCVHGLDEMARLKGLENDYVDLGNIFRIDKNECLGAILWQIFKARKDPVKALIKTLLIVYYHFQEQGDPLPCDVLKARIFSDESKKIADPYVIIFLAVLKCTSDIGNRDLSVSLEESIFLRLSGYPSMKSKQDQIVKKILNGYVVLWGWESQKKERFSFYGSWSEQEKIKYEQKLMEQIGFIYDLVIKSSDDSKPAFQMKKADQEILLSKLAIYYRKKEGKISSCSAYLKANSETSNLIIHYDPLVKIWSIYNTPSRHRLKKEWIAYQSSGLIDVITWMIYNKLFSGGFSRIFFEDLPNTVKEKKLKGLFSFIYSQSSIYLKSGAIGEKPEWNLLIVVVIPDFNGSDNDAVQMCFIACNIWGEFYCISRPFDKKENNSIKSFKMAEFIYFKFLKDVEEIPYVLHNFCTKDGDDLLKRVHNFINEHKRKNPPKKNRKEIPGAGADDKDKNSIFLDAL